MPLEASRGVAASYKYFWIYVCLICVSEKLFVAVFSKISDIAAATMDIEYVDIMTQKIFRLLQWYSFIGQFVPPVGGEKMG